MRLTITNDKPHMIDFLEKYFNSTLLNQKVEAIVNGIKYLDVINENITIESKDPYYVMTIYFGEKKEEIPILLDKTKIRIGRTLYFLETDKHATMIEIIE